MRGHISDVFLPVGKTLDQNKCFTIVAKCRTLNLYHDNASVVKNWVEGLRNFLGMDERTSNQIFAKMIRSGDIDSPSFMYPRFSESSWGELHYDRYVLVSKVLLESDICKIYDLSEFLVDLIARFEIIKG